MCAFNFYKATTVVANQKNLIKKAFLGHHNYSSQKIPKLFHVTRISDFISEYPCTIHVKYYLTSKR